MNKKREAVEEASKDKKHVEKGNKDVKFNYHIARVDEDKDASPEATLDDYVLGIRPEVIKIVSKGGIEAEVYSAMPTGMETTLRLRIGNFILTGVVFGGITYKIGQTVHIKFEGDGISLFSRESGRIIDTGALEV